MSVKRAPGSSSGRTEASPAVALTVPLMLPVTPRVCVVRDKAWKARASVQSEIRIRLGFFLIIKAASSRALRFGGSHLQAKPVMDRSVTGTRIGTECLELWLHVRAGS